jgi:hypothetical protein
LNIFYLCLKHVWPENYFGLSGSVDPIVSRNLLRWGVFRYAPPMIMAAAASLTAERANGLPWLAASLTASLHIWPLARTAAARLLGRSWSQAAGYLLLAASLAAAMALSTAFRSSLAPVIPLPRDLVSNIWAGLLAAIGAVYIQQIALVRRQPADLVSKSLREIPMPLKRHAYLQALKLGLDPRVPLAVMAAENLQRPAWLRRLEFRLPAGLRPTRGIMQQKGAASDLHSIDLAFANEFQQGNPALDPADPFFPNMAFETYNTSKAFVSLAVGAYQAMAEDASLLAAVAATAEPAASKVTASGTNDDRRTVVSGDPT